MMKRRPAKLLIVTLLTVGLVLASCMGVIARDRHQRGEILRTVAQELPVGADQKQIEAFLSRHTVNYSFDDWMSHEYVGSMTQTWLDRRLASRKVRVHLRVNADRTFKEAEVRVHYTLP